MNKLLLALVVTAPLTMALSGCVIKINDDGIEHGYVKDNDDRAYKNRKKIAKVILGTSFMDIQEKLGVADFSETYKEEGKTIRVLYYRTQKLHKDGVTTKDECTYLYFVDGELIKTGMGETVTKVNS